jgi:hypothetical protein
MEMREGGKWKKGRRGKGRRGKGRRENEGEVEMPVQVQVGRVLGLYRHYIFEFVCL